MDDQRCALLKSPLLKSTARVRGNDELKIQRCNVFL